MSGSQRVAGKAGAGVGLLVTNLFATPGQPNRGIFNQRQFREVVKRRPLDVLVPRPTRWPIRHRTPDPVTVAGFASGSVVCFDVWHPPLIGRWVNARLLARQLYRLVESRGMRPRFVIGCFAYPDGVAAALLARRLRVPSFIKVHGSDVNVMATDRFIQPQIRWAMSTAAGVVAVSRALERRIGELGFEPRRLAVVYNGIDREQFWPGDRDQARRELGLPAGRRSILYVGNLKPDKGVLDLLEAFAVIAPQLIEVDLDFVGAGVGRSLLAARAEQLGLTSRVRLHGERKHDQVPLWLRASELLCLPSHAEGVPNVVLEAQASGRPVVATNVGGVPEVLGAEGGMLVKPRDRDALARALAQTLERLWEPDRVAAASRACSWADSAMALDTFIEGSLVETNQ